MSENHNNNNNEGGRCSTNNDDQKRQKSHVEDDLICAISLQLPYDPVMAEDGRIYERSAIEDHINSKEGMELKSPITHKKMGKKLLPSPQIKNTIETLIEIGVITGDVAETWKEKDQQKKDMDEMIKEAEDGDADSMYWAGFNYEKGIQGFPQNNKRAYKWIEKAHTAGYNRATAHLAWMLLEGRGICKNEKEGLTFLGVAAANGSDYAAWMLGKAFAAGKYGFSIRKMEAIKWLKVALGGNCLIKQLTEEDKQEAQKLLYELVKSRP